MGSAGVSARCGAEAGDASGIGIGGRPPLGVGRRIVRPDGSVGGGRRGPPSRAAGWACRGEARPSSGVGVLRALGGRCEAVGSSSSSSSSVIEMIPGVALTVSSSSSPGILELRGRDAVPERHPQRLLALGRRLVAERDRRFLRRRRAQHRVDLLDLRRLLDELVEHRQARDQRLVLVGALAALAGPSRAAGTRPTIPSARAGSKAACSWGRAR